MKKYLIGAFILYALGSCLPLLFHSIKKTLRSAMKIWTIGPVLIKVKAILYVLTISSIFIFACSKAIENDTNEIKFPYPSISEQRLCLLNKPLVTPLRDLDSSQIIQSLEYLSADACEGRKPGTAGHELAKKYILTQMRAIRVDSFSSSLEQPFRGFNINGTDSGANLVGWLRGTSFPDKYIVLTAHYDHLGKNANGEIYNGADDNASGVACLLALAKYFKQKPHPYSLVFAALDREETWFEGAYNLVHFLGAQMGEKNIKLNLNMDMISRSDSNEIYACGLRHYPSFKYLIEEAQNKTNTKLLMGHDGGISGRDWTNASDHSAFDQRNIPFLYIGVEDHEDYHTTTDDKEKINYSRFIENCNLIYSIIQTIK